MRFAAYNVEWFNSLFDDGGALIFDGGWSGRYNVTRAEQLNALGTVFSALDADAVMVIEAPDHSKTRSTILALENFANHFGLRTNRVLIGFSNDTQQEIALLYDPDVLTARHKPHASPTAPRFDAKLEIDLDVDARLDCVTFSKPPLEVEISLPDGRRLMMLGVHLKSKAPHGARSPAEAMQISITNRRKQLAQAIWLRRRVTQLIDSGQTVVVLGDFNDGPGLDEYEHLFGRSSIEIIMGEDLEPHRQLYDPNANAILSNVSQEKIHSASFTDKTTGAVMRALLDYVFISDTLKNQSCEWRIWAPNDGDGKLAHAVSIASDHYPVTLDFK